MDWKTVSEVDTGTSGTLGGVAVGNGLLLALGTLSASVTSGITFIGGQIGVAQGSGIALDMSGNLTINPGVGLTLSGGLLTVAAGAGLGFSAGQIVIPGGAITDSLIQPGGLLAVSVNLPSLGAAIILAGTVIAGTANIQNGAITTLLVANGAIGTLQCSSISASVISTGTLNATVSVSTSGSIICNGSGGATATLSLAELEFTNGSLVATHTAGQSSWTTTGYSCSCEYNQISLGAGSFGFTVVAGATPALSDMEVTFGSTSFLLEQTSLVLSGISLACAAFGANGKAPQNVYVTVGALSGGASLSDVITEVNSILTALTLCGIAS